MNANVLWDIPYPQELNYGKNMQLNSTIFQVCF